jgi:hypothetical protein
VFAHVLFNPTFYSAQALTSAHFQAAMAEVAVGDAISTKRGLMDSIIRPRKRTRGNPSDLATGEHPIPTPPPPPPVSVERRRVNPESLARRLGPDLVREMEVYISSGNKEMPSFAIRRELHERYGIDRRHVYDYFHSRGLRVVKEEKHQNLTRARPKVNSHSQVQQVKKPFISICGSSYNSFSASSSR